MRVIIIDDHALFRDGLKALLELRSIDVAGVAADGKEGIELAKIIQPDIILLDLRMPNMGGLHPTHPWKFNSAWPKRSCEVMI